VGGEELYRDCHRRIVALLDGQDGTTPVPACPGWTVKGVVSHLGGSLADARTGRLRSVPTNEWTAGQVEARRDWTLEECLREWADEIAISGPLLGAVPILTADVVSHEHDVRAALGRPGGRETEAVRVGAAMFAEALEGRIRRRRLPALALCRDGLERVLGEGEPAARLRATSFEVMRAVSGRRTEDEVRAMDWDGDCATGLPFFFVFGPTASSIGE
jgi:uncharacterized protein (TIGR03083 family)